jgi:6-phosphogluconolactonase
MPWPFPQNVAEHVIIFDDFVAGAVTLIGSELSAAAQARQAVSFVLAGGGTPLAVYAALAGRADVPWPRVHVFWGDERLVPPDDPGSNYRAAREALLTHLPIPAENVHRPRGEWPAEAAVADYATQLRAWAAARDPGAPHPWPRFDVVLLGLGEDGHTASLFPGSTVEAEEPVLAVSADYQGRPAGRVTLTPAVINDARHVIFLITGAGKAEAVYQTLRGADDPRRYPAQRIRPADGQVTWLLDRAAAARLPVTLGGQ